MSVTKKLLSVFLSVLIMLSSVTVGLTTFAADATKIYSGLDENYQALATALQKSYVVDANNYQQINKKKDYVANDNEDGDIAAAAQAYYKIIDASDKKRYGTSIKAVETKLKSAMGSDYNSSTMGKAIGYISGNGSISAYTSNGTFKFTVNQNINLILNEYESVSDIPDTAKDKATVYTYTQTGTSISYKTTLESVNADVSTAAFKDFAAMFNADIISSDYADLPDGMLENIDENGQNVINAAKTVSDKNIQKFLGNDVSIDKAQAYLDGILLYKAREYTNTINTIKSETDGKKIEDYNFDDLSQLKAKLDDADKLYNSYVDLQKESVKEAHEDYENLVKFYEESYNYNKEPEYAEAVKKVEKYADESYEFTKEELPDVKKLLDEADKKYSEFLGTPTYPTIIKDKEIYDKALANYTKAYEYYDWQEYYAQINEFAKSFDNETVLRIPDNAHLSGSNMTLSDDADNSIYDTETKFVNLINFLYTKHGNDYKNIESVITKITNDLAGVIGENEVKEKDIYNILLTYLHNGSVTKNSYNKTIIIKPAYLLEYDSVNDIPESIKYQNHQFSISYNRTSLAFTSFRDSATNSTDTTAYGAFSLFALTFTDELYNTNLEECSFDELSLIKRKVTSALKGISDYTESDIAHFFGNNAYANATALNIKCDELMKKQYIAMVNNILDEYGDRKVDANEAEDFFNECEMIDDAYNQLTDNVKNSDEVKQINEKYNELKLYVKDIADKANAEEFVDMVNDFEKKYPKKSLNIDIYDEFKADIKVIFDFYSACSEETKANKSVIKASEKLTELNDAMDKIFKEYRFEQFKKSAKEKLDPLYTGDLENAQIIEFTTFDIAKIKQIIVDINKIYGDLSDKDRERDLVINYMAVVSKLNERIELLQNPPEFKAFSVEYPDGVSQEQIDEIITVLNNVMSSGLIENLAGKSLDAIVNDALNGLFTADLINTVVSALYPLVADALGSNASLAGLLGINVLPRTLASNIKHYPAVKSALEAAGNDWNAVDWELCDWVNAKGKAVTDVDTFIDAFGESLSGLTKVINVLLNGVTLNAVVITKGRTQRNAHTESK